MSSIEELQNRVSEAEQRFGLIKAQRAKYSERLVGLIDAIESRLRDQHAEIERQAAEIAAQSEELNTTRNAVAENQALRGMLHSLLRAIETGGRDVLNETMQVMDAKVSTLIQRNVKAVPALGHAGMDEIEADLGELEAAEDVEASAPAIAELESPEAVDSDFVSPDAESSELESEIGADAVTEIEPAVEMDLAADTVAEAPLAIEEDLPEALEAAADAVEAITGEEPAEQAEPIEDAQSTAFDEAVSDDGLEAFADGIAPEAPSENDPLAALESDLEDVATAEPEMVAEELTAEQPEPAAEDAVEGVELDASEGDAMLAEEPLAEAEAPDPGIAEFSETESEFGTEIEAQSEPESEPMAAEMTPESDLPEADETDAEIGDPGTLEGFDDSGEAATLEEIMRRVSRLVEEEGALGKPTHGSVRIGAEPSAEKPKAASNG